MPIIQCDIREGWTDAQKEKLGDELTRVVHEVRNVPVSSIHVVIREARGLHYTFGGKRVPEFKRGS
jgi:4-oxalocrotonate tautomerase family enzyme